MTRVTEVLVDTHVALWAIATPEKLSDRETELLIDPTVKRWLSPVSVWEAAIKRELGKLRAPSRLAEILGEEFALLELTADLLESAAELPRHHGDPFDRVLIAHALRDDLSIVSRDVQFDEYGVRRAG